MNCYAARSARRLRSAANVSNIGCRSGIDRVINGASRPLNSSRIANATSPAGAGVSVKLTPAPAGEVAFAMREEFSGLLAPLITRSIPDLQPMFETFAADLKRRAERAA